MSTRLTVTTALAAFAPACGDSTDNTIIISDPVGETIDAGHALGASVAAQASGELSLDDYDTLIGKSAGIIAAIHSGEVEASLFAAPLVLGPDTFELANDEIISHEDAHARLDDVIRSYGVPYLPSQAQVRLSSEASAAVSALRVTPPADLDFAYVTLQVTVHAEAQLVLDELASLVGPGDMGNYIVDTRVMVNDHLARASSMLDTFY
ncbi:MAG TPA: hypothetical protein VL326_26580 [Kofleriaceae bacterium]|nr:hypothetical protein [Kofleriaceae bacterium]